MTAVLKTYNQISKLPSHTIDKGTSSKAALLMAQRNRSKRIPAQHTSNPNYQISALNRNFIALLLFLLILMATANIANLRHYVNIKTLLMFTLIPLRISTREVYIDRISTQSYWSELA